MKLQFQPSLGYLAPTKTPKGLGVFASRMIDADEIVEIAPVICLGSAFAQLETELQRRVFDWERLASFQGISAVALGYGSMYNHGNPANMRYESAFGGGAIAFVAARAINVDEELTINYNNSATLSSEDIWFNICDVDRVENGPKG